MLRNLEISLFYHPTTIVLIDDNPDYLKQISWMISKRFPCKTFTNPLHAIKFLNDLSKERFSHRYLTLLDDEEIGRFSFTKEIQSIQKEMVRSDRFSQIIIILTDYAMPEVNGIELSQQINKDDFFVVLLTGNANFQLAIQAFNEKKIDRFLKKGIEEIKTVVFQTIEQLEKQYFLNMSNILLGKIDKSILSALENKLVAKQFFKIIKEDNIVEYKIISDVADFLFFNEHGDLSLFSVKSNEDIEKMCEWASIEVNENLESTLNALKNKEKIPLFSSLEELETTSPEDWNLYPTQKIPGLDDYVFAYTKLPSLKKNNTLTFHDYLSSIREELV